MTTAKELLHPNNHIKRIGPGEEGEHPGTLLWWKHGILNSNINTVPMAMTTPDQNT